MAFLVHDVAGGERHSPELAGDGVGALTVEDGVEHHQEAAVQDIVLHAVDLGQTGRRGLGHGCDTIESRQNSQNTPHARVTGSTPKGSNTLRKRSGAQPRRGVTQPNREGSEVGLDTQGPAGSKQVATNATCRLLL